MALDSLHDVDKKLSDLEKLLAARATTNATGDRQYKSLRSELLTDERVGQHLPDFVQQCESLNEFWKFIQKFPSYEERRAYIKSAFEGTREKVTARSHSAQRVFIGHGHSLIWRILKDFLSERLKLDWDEFNREATAGYSTKERLETLLDNAQFALMVMTAEEERPDGELHARDNVIHEVGLFQGRLGFSRAIVLLEEGCAGFSNIQGITYIPFPKGNIEAAFERLRQVLEREHLIASDGGVPTDRQPPRHRIL